EALRLEKDAAGAYCNLGIALRLKGRLDEAIAAYREALRLNKDDAEVHSNLGNALKDKGHLDEAIAEGREALRLTKEFPNARNIPPKFEAMPHLRERLPGLLSAKVQPKDVAECLAFAQLCQSYPRQYAAAARLYGEAFAQQPMVADDLRAGHRYNAACT